jgi:hypothetical protein
VVVPSVAGVPALASVGEVLIVLSVRADDVGDVVSVGAAPPLIAPLAEVDEA